MKSSSLFPDGRIIYPGPANSPTTINFPGAGHPTTANFPTPASSHQNTQSSSSSHGNNSNSFWHEGVKDVAMEVGIHAAAHAIAKAPGALVAALLYTAPVNKNEDALLFPHGLSTSSTTTQGQNQLAPK